MKLRTVVLLGLLAAPRVVLHDLDLIQEGTAVNAVLVFLPILIWIAAAVRWAGNPFLALTGAGLVYGVCLVIGHNIWGDIGEARLGGNLAGRLSGGAEEAVLRVAMSVSSLFTGIAVGVIAGAVAWLIARGLRRSRGDERP